MADNIIYVDGMAIQYTLEEIADIEIEITFEPEEILDYDIDFTIW